MKKSEVAKLLTIAAEFDGKPVTPERVELWSAVIGDFEYSEAAEAVRHHFRTSEWPLRPAHIAEWISEKRRTSMWDMPHLSPAEHQLCIDAGVPPEEFVERRDEPGWVEHLKSKWQGIES